MADENQELIDRIEKLETINKELKEEKTELKAKYKGVDVEEFLELKKYNSDLESKNTKLEKANGVLTKDAEKLNTTITENNKNLRQLVVTDGIAKALNGLEKHKLNDGALALATLDIESKGVELIDGVPMIGETTMSDYITKDWLESSSSKNLVTANENSGGGSQGGNNSGGGNADRSKMTPDQMMNAGRE